MEVKSAYSYAEELGILKFFPSNGAAIAKIAELIADLCANESQARVLVDLMCKRFDEWPGPVTLQAVYAERFRSQHEPEWKPSYAIPAPPDCQDCADNGFLKNRLGIYQRCHCETAKGISEEMISDFNRWSKTRRMPSGEIIVRRVN